MSFNSVLFDDYCSLECDAMSSINLPTFHTNLLSPSSCRRGNPTKRRHMPHAVTRQEAALRTVTPVVTSNITCLLFGGRMQWKSNCIREETAATRLMYNIRMLNAFGHCRIQLTLHRHLSLHHQPATWISNHSISTSLSLILATCTPIHPPPP